MKNKHIDNFEKFKVNENNDNSCDLSLIGGDAIYKNENLEVRKITEFSELSECWNCGCYWAVCHKDTFFNWYKEKQGDYYLIMIDGYPEYLTQRGFDVFSKANKQLTPQDIDSLYLQYPGLEDIIN